MRLVDLPDGARILVDANIMAYHRIQVPGLTEAATGFLERVEQRKVHGYTSTALVAEAVHKIMLAEAIQQHGLPPTGVVTRLKEKPQLVRTLVHQAVTEEVVAMGISVEVVTTDVLSAAEGLFSRHGLLTNDSITLALMEHLGLEDIATNDRDFDAVGTVTVWKPF